MFTSSLSVWSKPAQKKIFLVEATIQFFTPRHENEFPLLRRECISIKIFKLLHTLYSKNNVMHQEIMARDRKSLP
jgi:hypothetical protein